MQNTLSNKRREIRPERELETDKHVDNQIGSVEDYEIPICTILGIFITGDPG